MGERPWKERLAETEQRWAEEDLRNFIAQLGEDLERWRVAAEQGARHSPPPSQSAYERLSTALRQAKVRAGDLLKAAYPEPAPPPSPRVGSSGGS